MKNEKLQIAKIKLSGFLGIEKAEIETGKVTIISGKNGLGKTSIIEGIRTGLQGGNAGKFINRDSDSAIIGIEFDNDLLVQKKITATKSTIEVTNDGFKKSKPAEYLKSLFNFDTINPIEIIGMQAKDRKELILNNITFDYPEQEIKAIGDLLSSKLHYSGNAIDDLNNLHTQIYNERTGINRVIKEKQATNKQLDQTLNKDLPNIDILLNELATIEKDFHLNKRAWERQTEENNSKCEIDKTTTKEDIEITRQQIQTLKDRLLSKENDIKIIDMKYKDIQNDIDRRKDKRESELELQTKELYSKKNIIQIQDNTCQTIANNKLQIDKYNDESTKLSTAIKDIDKLKTNLLNNIPIKGISFEDNDIFIDGIAFDSLNTSQKVQRAVDIALLNKPPFLIIDGAECLDTEAFNGFVDAVKKRDDVQLIITRVTDEEKLTVTNE